MTSALKKDNNFTLLRLIFASMVVASHILYLPNIAELHSLRKYTAFQFGLQGFFVVSGFLVVFSYDRNKGLGDYFAKRFKRILPAYFFVVASCAIGLQLLSKLTPIEYFSSLQFWKYLIFNMCFMNFAAPSLPGVFEDNMMKAVNGSLWTIKIELAFYFAVPILMTLSNKFGARRVFLISYAASFMWTTVFETLHESTGNPIFHTLAVQAPGQFTYFLGGAAAYLYLKSGRTSPNFIIAATALFVYVMSSGFIFDLLAPIAITTLTCYAAYRLKPLSTLNEMGDYSYGIYIYHWPVIQIAVAIGLFRFNPTAAIFLCVITVFLLAILSWKYVERPFTTTKRIAAV